MKKTFPPHGIFGIILLILSEILSLKKVDPFYSWFYCFAWWSYIFTIDAIIYRLKGNSLIVNRTKEFFLMIPWSTFIWLIFEAANLSLENWYYINLPHSAVERWLGYAIAYGTVLPGLFETKELLESIGLFKKLFTKQILISQRNPYPSHSIGDYLSYVLSPLTSIFLPLDLGGIHLSLRAIQLQVRRKIALERS